MFKKSIILVCGSYLETPSYFCRKKQVNLRGVVILEIHAWTVQITFKMTMFALTDMLPPELAEVLTKLAKFVEAEWPDRKLLILEAWDEATSAHPLGSHGNQSLFYTGRAARVALSRNLTSKEPETDQNTFQRFTQLLQCSDADFFDTYMRNSVLDICVSDESAAFFTNTENNRKKRAIKSNNIVKTNTWRQEKDKYDEQISGLGLCIYKIYFCEIHLEVHPSSTLLYDQSVI